VLFEPVLTTHVAGTYVMELGMFETFTDAVQEARNARWVNGDRRFY